MLKLSCIFDKNVQHTKNMLGFTAFKIEINLQIV